MRRFRNILFVVNEKTRPDGGVLQRTAERAQANGATLTLVRVLRLPWGAPGAKPTDELEIELENRALADWKRRLQSLARPVSRKGVRVSTAVLLGRPFIQIIERVLHDGIDLVVLAAERGTLGGMFFGTTSMHLIRKCPCAVWVIKPGRKKKFRRILAAVDTDPYDPPQTDLNRTILELASSQARRDGAELHVVHAWDVTLSHLLRRPSGMSGRRQQAYTRRIRGAHREAFEELLGRVELSDLSVHVHLGKGDPSRVITRLAARAKVDHLVMGSLGRVGLPGLLIGNTAERVLQKVRCSVLTAKPEGFISPVGLEVREVSDESLA